MEATASRTMPRRLRCHSLALGFAAGAATISQIHPPTSFVPTLSSHGGQRKLCSRSQACAEALRADRQEALPRRRAVAALAPAALVMASLGVAPAGAKVALTPQYSAQEMAGLKGQSNLDVAKYIDLGNDLKYEVLVVAKENPDDPEWAREVREGDTVTVDLVGRLAGWNGLIFFKSTDKGGFSESPVTFRVGAHEALPGLERAVIGMKKGDVRRVVIPPLLGYPRPIKAEDLGKPGAIPDPGAGSPSAGSAWELRNRLVNGVLNNSEREDTLVMDVKVKRMG